MDLLRLHPSKLIFLHSTRLDSRPSVNLFSRTRTVNASTYRRLDNGVYDFANTLRSFLILVGQVTVPEVKRLSALSANSTSKVF